MRQDPNWLLKCFRVALVVILLSAGTALRIEGFTSRWPNDWRGSMACYYGNIARNYLTFGLAATKAAPVSSVTPDSLDEAEYYLHHPPLTGWTVALSIKVFKPAEWPQRIFPLALSILSLLLIYLIGKNLWGWLAGVVALAVMTFIPGAVFYGTFVDAQGPVPLFFTLWTVFAYLKFCDKTTVPRLAHVLIAFSLGTLSDWPVYYLAVLLPLHHLIFCRKRSWKIVALPVAGISLFALFWIYASWVEGYPLDAIPQKILSLATSRFKSSATIPVRQSGPPVSMLFGPYFIHIYATACTVFFIAGMCLLAARLWRKTSLQSDGMLAVFTALALIYVFMFLKTASLHDFWLYHFIPPVALSIGLLLSALAAVFRRWPVVAVVSVVLPLSLCVADSYTALRQWLAKTSYTFSTDAVNTAALLLQHDKLGLLLPETDFPMFQHFAMYIPGKVFQADINRLNLEAAANNPRVNWVFIDSIGPDGDDLYLTSLRLFKRAAINKVFSDNKMADESNRSYRMRCGMLSNPKTVLEKMGTPAIHAPSLLEKRKDGNKIRLRWHHPEPGSVLAYIVYARKAGQPFFRMVDLTDKTEYEYLSDGGTGRIAVTAVGKDYEESLAAVVAFGP